MRLLRHKRGNPDTDLCRSLNHRAISRLYRFAGGTMYKGLFTSVDKQCVLGNTAVTHLSAIVCDAVLDRREKYGLADVSTNRGNPVFVPGTGRRNGFDLWAFMLLFRRSRRVAAFGNDAWPARMAMKLERGAAWVTSTHWPEQNKNEYPRNTKSQQKPTN